MPVRPSWHDDYWKQLDKETAKKMRITWSEPLRLDTLGQEVQAVSEYPIMGIERILP